MDSATNFSFNSFNQLPAGSLYKDAVIHDALFRAKTIPAWMLHTDLLKLMDSRGDRIPFADIIEFAHQVNLQNAMDVMRRKGDDLIEQKIKTAVENLRASDRGIR
jgi:hypothetical protein